MGFLLRFYPIVLAVLYGLLLSLIIWGLPRGLSFGDEAYSFFTYEDPNRYIIVASGMGHLIHAITSWMNPTVLTYRWLRLILTILGSLAFFAGFYPWYQAYKQKKGLSSGFWSPSALFFYLGIGNLATHFSYAQSIHYNNLTNFLVLSALGAIFYSATFLKNRKTLLLCAGVFSGISLFVKFPATVLFLIATGLIYPFLILSESPSKTAWLRLVIVFILGILVSMVAYFILVQSFQSYTNQIIPFMVLASKNSHALSWLLPVYAKSIIAMFNVFIGYGGWIPLVMVLWLAFSERGQVSSNITSMQRIGLILFPLVFLLLAFRFDFHRPTVMFAKVFWLLLACMASYVVVRGRLIDKTVQNKSTQVILVFFLILPILAAFGTNIGLTNLIYTMLLPWFVVSVMLIDSLVSQSEVSKAMANCFAVLMIIFSVLHAWYGYVQEPLGLKQSLLNQTEKIPELPKMTGLRVDPITKQSLLSLKAHLDRTGFKPGDPLLAFYNISGLVHAMGGIPYGGGYYSNGMPTFEEENCYVLLENMSPDQRQPAAILQLGPILPGFSACLKHQGVDILHQYHPVGMVDLLEDPRLQIKILARSSK